MIRYPGYREDWREHVMSSTTIMMGTEAQHQLGDISRDEPDYFVYGEEDDEAYIGNWLTGLGFINVRFPKATSRPMTDEEREYLAARPVVIG